MSLKIDQLSKSMESLFNDIVLKSNILYLDDFKNSIYEKQVYVDNFIKSFLDKDNGKISVKLIEKMQEISSDFNELYENFDDKLMIFIVGNGNVGKSTLLNALAGQEIAKTNFLPTTWKIDVYSPELDDDVAIIKYKDGKQEVLNIEKAKKKVSDEENKSKDRNKLFKEILRNKTRDIKNKEQLKEIKKHLSEKHQYKSKISEVRWPVKTNWILECCLLVDTPGLNQELNSLEQLGSVNSYYHKADGVIWILSGQTIASETPSTLLKELDTTLENVGGVRDNIIGVVNRIDLVRNNGGQEAVEKVHNDAVKHFGNKFTDIIDISAKQAYEGIRDKDKVQIEESGILQLQNAIRNIFIAKANTIKNNAKIQGSNKLVNNTEYALIEFRQQIEEYENIYIDKLQNLQTSKEKLLKNIKSDFEAFFKSYINDVDKRVEIYIDELANGKGIEFIKDTMYKLNEFESNRNTFIKNKKLEIQNNANTWQKLCKISEYKYIQIKSRKNELKFNTEMNLNSINASDFFTPSAEGTLMSGLSNFIGKTIFFIKKNRIKKNIMYSISNQCNEMEKKIVIEVEYVINSNFKKCSDLLDVTFKELLFEFKNIKDVKTQIDSLRKNINQSKSERKVQEIIGINNK